MGESEESVVDTVLTVSELYAMTDKVMRPKYRNSEVAWLAMITMLGMEHMADLDPYCYNEKERVLRALSCF